MSVCLCPPAARSGGQAPWRGPGRVCLWSGLRLIMAHVSCRQVSQDGKSLLDKLQRPLTPGSSDSLTASANYSKAVHHVLDVIHEVLHHQRQLENIWQHRKVRLHQRLQLCVFQQDVQQVSGAAACGVSVWVQVS